jgi:hypothetical protein
MHSNLFALSRYQLIGDDDAVVTFVVSKLLYGLAVQFDGL